MSVSLQNGWYLFLNRIRAAGIIDIIDIIIVAYLIYNVIILIRQTHTAQLAKGILVLLGVYIVADLTGMRMLKYLINSVMSFGLIALVIVFQPELRRALETVGRSSVFGVQMFQSRNSTLPADLRSRWKSAVVALCDAVERLSDTHTGALIVLERKTNLSEIIKTGTMLDADVNSEMLCTIFYVGTPLHDGATVIRDGRVIASGCFLPLSNNLEIGKDMGTRHRAALGMSENSDAVVIVVSEETGIISYAKNGVLIRRLDRQNLFNLLDSDIVPPPENENKKAPWWSKLWRKNDGQ